MKARALRGVCIGVERHLAPGDIADIDPGTFTFLSGIGAVEAVPDDRVETTNAPAEKQPTHLSKAQHQVVRDEADASKRDHLVETKPPVKSGPKEK
jgi:hypothetical protein